MKLAAIFGIAILATTAFAATNTHVADPTQVPDETPPRVNVGDFPAGWDIDSWQGPATGKSNWHARYIADSDYLSAIFPDDAATLTVNDIARISYWTNRPAGTPAGRDWWIQIYTRPTGSGDCSGWYKHRLISNYNDHTDTSGTWVQYATDDASPMTWNENSCLGGGEMTLADMKTTLDGELIEMFSVQTDSGWNGFDGYMDGLEIELTNGSIGRVNFENVPALPATSTLSMIGLFLLLATGLALVLALRSRRTA